VEPSLALGNSNKKNIKKIKIQKPKKILQGDKH